MRPAAGPNQTKAPTSPTSLHERILTDIEGKILSGEWAPGARIPFEHELSQIYACSRMTVNKALSQLAKAGLILRRRKAGSFVKRPPSPSAVLEILDIKAEVEAFGLPYRFEILSRRRRAAGKRDAARLENVGQGQVLELTCRHWAGKSPFCLEERLINLTAVPDAAEERFQQVSPSPWLIARVPWTTAEHKIRACSAGAMRGALLCISEDSACLMIERRTWSSDQAITFVTLTYRGEDHVLVARFSPTHR